MLTSSPPCGPCSCAQSSPVAGCSAAPWTLRLPRLKISGCAFACFANGLLAGIFVASPFVLYQVWLFISPGLYRNEKRYVFPFMFSTIGLFLAGGYFGYRLVYPAALDFLIGYGKQFQPMITIGEYTSLFMTVILGLGVVFEMPILVFFLALMGVVSAGWMWRNIRYSVLVIFIIAAIITPTADILNMCIFAAPMIGLYLFSIGIAWMVHPKQRKARLSRKSK